MRFICSAGRTEQFEQVSALGIGSLAACASLCKQLAAFSANEISEIVFVGSCGLYSSQSELLGVYEFSQAMSISTAELASRAYRPIKSEGALLNSLEAITANDEDAAAFAKFGLIAENMEAAGVFAAARAFGMSARCILVATNYVGERSHEQYIANHLPAKAQMQHLINQLRSN